MPAPKPSAHTLRNFAEALLPESPAGQFRPGASREDIGILLRELRLHEIELELQNAALREAQYELELSRAKFCELYECAPIPYLYLAADSTIVAANHAAAVLLKSSREALVGTRFSRCIAADDCAKFALHQRAAANSDSCVSCRLALQVAGAESQARIHSIRCRSDQRASLTMITDLSDHLLAQTLEAHAFTSAILDAAGPIAVLDPSGRIIQLNRACGALLGEAHAATGRELWEVLTASPEQCLQARQCLQAALTDGEAPPWESTFVGPGGSSRHVIWSFGPLAVEHGGPLRYAIASGDDVTAIKAMKAQLDLSERLVPIGRLAAGVGHEINNPLTYVRASLELAATSLSGLPANHDKLKHALDVALEGVDRIRLIVDDLRVLSSHDVRSVAAVNVHELLDACVQVATNEIRHRARLLLDYGDVPRVAANAGRLSQVFLNLLVNAAQSIAPGHAGSNEIRLSTRRGVNGGVIVTIRDSGAGIAAHDLPRIFDPFFTTKAVGEGTGLGLSICRGIIAELGGQISVGSTPGAGTTFDIWLPAATVPAAAPAVAAREPIASKASTAQHILIIDDEPRITESCVLLLGEYHHVKTASSGRDALELCQREELDVIFCDLRMPEMDGNEIYRTIEARNPAQARRIVFMTGSLMSAPELHACDHGDVTLLRKPFAARDVNAVLEACFDRKSALAALTAAGDP